MKKIISGKMYNTETAREVGTYWNGYSNRDFNSLTERLYVKKTGEYFLHGVGGPMTRYSEPCGNMTSGGEKIIPLTKEEAIEWCEKHISADDFEAEFGVVEE